MKTKITNNNTKPKRKFKMPSALSIIIGVVVFAAILTWIPHGNSSKGISGTLDSWQQEIFWTNFNLVYIPGDYENNLISANEIVSQFGLQGYIVGEGENIQFITEAEVPWTLSGYSDGMTSRFGLFDTVKAMIGGYWMAAGVSLYLIGIFAVVELLIQTGTLKSGVSSLAKGLNGKEIVLLPVLFLLFSLGGTLFGMQEETLGLLPIIVPVIILIGFDAPAGMMVAVLGTTTGIAASALDPFSVGVMAAGLNTGIGTGILERMILFTIYTSIGMTFITWYGMRVRKNMNKSAEFNSVEENKLWAEKTIGNINELETMNGKQKSALIIFAVVFAWMIFALMPWTEWFPSLSENEGWIVFSSIFYGKVLLGQWYFVELAILFFLAAILIASIFNYSTAQIGNVFWMSLKGMFGVITIISFSRATSVILSTSGLTYGMIYGMTNPEKLQNVSPTIFMLTWLPIFLVMALFIPSTSGLAGITAPIIGGVIQAGSGGWGPEKTELIIVGILMIYPLAQGVINMFSPTTGLVVVQAEQSRVSFGKILPWLATYAGIILMVGLVSTTTIMLIEN